MIPRELLASSTTPDGHPLTLTREATHLVVRVRGVPLMSSAVHGSEEAMAEIACAPLGARQGARVLIGGLGLGFTLRAALDLLGADAVVEVVELLPAIIEWNRGPLADVAGRPLEDPRAIVKRGDIVNVLRVPKVGWDAILLDVDNGPEALTSKGNARLYDPAGLARLRAALRPEGVAVVWSAFTSRSFEERLSAAGFDVETVAVRARGKVAKGARHTLYVARLGEESKLAPRR